MSNRFISLMIFAPLVGALLQALLPQPKSGEEGPSFRWVALGSSLIGSLVAIALSFGLQGQGPDASIGVSHPWVGFLRNLL